MLQNPYRPGAGHVPPYLAGRDHEVEEFRKLLEQPTILKNCVLTGLRGVGKTVLLTEFRNTSIREGWLWTENEVSESTTTSDDRLAYRLLADLSMLTSNVKIYETVGRSPGFAAKDSVSEVFLDFPNLEYMYQQCGGLESDKLKYVFETVWREIHAQLPATKGIVFAYDEAQSLGDFPKEKRYPMTLLLDVFQSIQRKGIPFLLLLTGLPTIQTKLVESRTYSERMFTVLFLKKLSKEASRLAIVKPAEDESFPFKFDEQSVALVIEKSGGYPYFIQFLCKEIFDIFIQQSASNQKLSVPIDSIIRKLDDDFFSGRWGMLTDRQREVLALIANLESAQEEFTVQEIVNSSKEYDIAPIGNSQVNQMLSSLSATGLVFKNRFGRYSLAVPQLDEFILRQGIVKRRAG